MFSEYASKFLAQSRITNSDDPPRNPYDRYRQAPNRPLSRPYHPPGNPSPYHPASTSRSINPFASYLSNVPQNAPLFHDNHIHFNQEDHDERQREDDDLYALQRSRRVFEDPLEESLGSESSPSAHVSRDDIEPEGDAPQRGIKSSWTAPHHKDDSTPHLHPSRPGAMVDINLESAMLDPDDEDLITSRGQHIDPVPFQKFTTLAPIAETAHLQGDDHASLPYHLSHSRRTSIDTIPQTVADDIAESFGPSPRHDSLWAQLYIISIFSMLATFLLVWLHTSSPGKLPLGDTIYTTLHASFHLLGVDTVVSIIVGMIWLALLQSAAKPLFYSLLVAVPVILISFSLLPFVKSFDSTSYQSKVMRLFSFVPAVIAVIWIMVVWRGRQSYSKAVGILEFAGKILLANPALIGLGLISLAAVVVFTWLWLLMFTRVFLGGHISGSIFIIDFTTWWLGIFFIMVYLWTLAVISGIQRTTTAAVVSQWYFHRNSDAIIPSITVVRAAFLHSLTTIFGTVAYSTFLTILVRLPLLILPRRIITLFSLILYSLIPTPIATLMSPLALTYAAIRSQPLIPSARALSQMSFSTAHHPATPLSPRYLTPTSPLLSYRLAKILLYSTRTIMSIALGFGGWVSTARQLALTMPDGAGIKGSAYAYIVGLVAAAIGWGVLGTIEGILTGIVDAAMVCWGIERGTVGGGTYCIEAGVLFGGERGALPR